MGYPTYSNRIVGMELHEAYSDAYIHSLKEEIVVDIFYELPFSSFPFYHKKEKPLLWLFDNNNNNEISLNKPLRNTSLKQYINPSISSTTVFVTHLYPYSSNEVAL